MHERLLFLGRSQFAKNRLSWYYVNDYLQNTTEEQITNLKLLDLLFALNAIYFNKPLDSIKL